MLPPSLTRWFALVALIALPVIVYSFALGAPLIFEDQDNLVVNPTIRRLWPLSDVLRAPQDAALAGRPITNLSFAINYAFSGLDPAPMRATNVALHVVTGLLLYGLLRRTFRRPPLRGNGPLAIGPHADGLALICTLLWSLHPLITDAVAYILQRTEVLACVFFVLTMYAAVRSANSRRGRWWDALAVGAFMLGMGSKEMVIGAPLAVAAHDHLFMGGTWREKWRQRRGLYLAFVLAAIVMILIVIVPGHHSASIGFHLGVSSLDWLYTQAGVLVLYLKLSFWPHPLSICYDWPIVRSLGGAIAPGSVIVALLGLTVWGLVRRHPAAMAGCVFFLVLAPSSSFVPLVNEEVAERRMYLPLAAVVSLAVVGVWVAVRRMVGRKQKAEPKQAGSEETGLGRVGVVVAAILVVVAVRVTVARLAEYHSERSLWESALRHDPKNSRALNNLGFILLQEGDPRGAEPLLRKALQLNPQLPWAPVNLGAALSELGRHEEAIPLLEAAVAARPNESRGQMGLGMALARAGRHDQAIARFRKMLEANPNDQSVWVHMGASLAAKQEFPRALEAFDRAVTLLPGDARARSNRGLVLMRMERWREAAAELEQAVKLDGTIADAWTNLGIVRSMLGDGAGTLEAFGRVAQLRPDSVSARINLAAALAQQGRWPDAIAQSRAAAELAPNQPVVHFQLGLMLQRAGKPAESIEPLQTATRLHPALAEAWDRLAIGLAATGRFDQATAAARLAIERANATGNRELAAQAESRLKLFEQRKPFEEPR